MSRIYFHSINGESEILGCERAYMGCFVSDLTQGIMDLDGYFTLDAIKPFLNPEHYLYKHRDNPNLIKMMKTSINVDSEALFILDGKEIDSFRLSLNTALTVGSDVVKLMARLHAQCEIHGYIEGKNRKWFSDIIERGLEEGVLRKEMGWEETITFLREDDINEVVTSYSVCEGFPNGEVANYDYPVSKEYPDELDYDAWYELPEEKQWELALKGLKENEKMLLEFTPENWNDVRFGDGMNVIEFKRRCEKKGAKIRI